DSRTRPVVGRTRKSMGVCPIKRSRYVLFSKKEKNIAINDVKDLSKYKTGVVKDDAGGLMLLAKGVPNSSLVIEYGTTGEKSNLRNLKENNIDLWIIEESSGRFLMSAENINQDDYKIVYDIEGKELCIAFNKETDEKIIKNLQTIMDDMVKTKVTQTIIDKYKK
ncbi:MAG: ABC transporter substrate-binding protein, partial [Oligoflexales bacterium]|nr:ABC transporter substrate-binding protein [Oligoflexales bacterium]